MRWWRHPVVLALLEVAVLGVALEAVYRVVMREVYRLDALWGTLFAIAAAVVACNGYHVCARFLARRRAQELAPERAIDALRGGALGAALICAAVGLLALLGLAHVARGGDLAQAGLPGVSLLAGAFEELIARGVLLRNLETVFGSVAAIALSALLFAALHLDNPGATPLSIAAVGIEGGVMLGAVFVATRSLWWTFGIHAAWNFTQTGIFGIADSGNAGTGWVQTMLTGPAWLSGGRFGIEASVISVALCVIVAIVFLRLAYRQHRFVAPFWTSAHAV